LPHAAARDQHAPLCPSAFGYYGIRKSELTLVNCDAILETTTWCIPTSIEARAEKSVLRISYFGSAFCVATWQQLQFYCNGQDMLVKSNFGTIALSSFTPYSPGVFFLNYLKFEANSLLYGEW
jgi:hypothetical protein